MHALLARVVIEPACRFGAAAFSQAGNPLAYYRGLGIRDEHGLLSILSESETARANSVARQRVSRVVMVHERTQVG
jgi:hypothetical protein